MACEVVEKDGYKMFGSSAAAPNASSAHATSGVTHADMEHQSEAAGETTSSLEQK